MAIALVLVAFMAFCAVIVWLVLDARQWAKRAAAEDAHEAKLLEMVLPPPWAIKIRRPAPQPDIDRVPFAEPVVPKCTVCRAVVGVGPHGRKLLTENNICSLTCLALVVAAATKKEMNDA